MRPSIKVDEADPCDLVEETIDRNPDLVVCSVASTVERDSAAFILLYPEGTGDAIAMLEGERIVRNDINLADVLEVIDGIVASDSPS